MLNSLRFDLEGATEGGGAAACKEAIRFFQRACDDAEKQAGRLVRKWLSEADEAAPWLSLAHKPNGVELMSTYDETLWTRWLAELNGVQPTNLLVISPFHDKNAALSKRVLNRWPKCKVEVVVQQDVTTLAIDRLQAFKKRLALSEIRDTSRRVHAKLLAWESKAGAGCIVGSANFTSAAFDGTNVETCLLIRSANAEIASLFDSKFAKRAISFEDFQPGTADEPEPLEENAPLSVESAIVTEGGELSVDYRRDDSLRGGQFYLALRLPSEIKPRAQFKVKDSATGSVTIKPERSLLSDSAAIMISLVAEQGQTRVESAANWVILESRLTQQASGDKGSSAERHVEETGEGLAEHLDGIARRDGLAAAIEYLRRLTIRFHSGGTGSVLGRPFKLHIKDPFKSDETPDWLLAATEHFESLAEAIYDFADRHEYDRLRRHARQGNVNGLPNFLDIFHTLVRTLYIYHVRGVVHRHQFVSRVSRYIQIAASGIDTEADQLDGYLPSVSDNLGGDRKSLQAACDEYQVVAHLFAAMMIAQRVRFVPGETLSKGRAPQRPRDCLTTSVSSLKETIRGLGLRVPSSDDVLASIKQYNTFAEAELKQFVKEIIV